MSSIAHRSPAPLARRRALRAALAGVLAALLLAGCALLPQGDFSGPIAGAKTTVPVMFVSGDRGSIGALTVTATPRDDGQLTVAISGDEVAGVRSQFEGAIWVATTLATLITGSDLSYDYRFEIAGQVDGPSAGGVTTAAVLSLILGDAVLPGVAMTGTITPTGTIGLVGGIPEKVQALVDAGYTKALIPLGTAVSPNTRGEQVDVVALGAAGGVEVIEVGDVAEAYGQLTGEALPGPSSVAVPRLTPEAAAKLQEGLTAQYQQYQAAEQRFLALSPEVRSWGAEIYQDAQEAVTKASALWDQQLYGGGYIALANANAMMSGTADAFALIERALREGIAVLDARFAEASQLEDAYAAFLDQLSAHPVATLADAEALIGSYGSSFDAFTLYYYATQQIDAIAQTEAEGGYADAAGKLEASVLPLLYLEFAEAQLGLAQTVFEVGTGLDGPPVAADADLGGIANFLSRAAEANLNALEANFIGPVAAQSGVTVERVWQHFSDKDLMILLARSSRGVFQSFIEPYLGADNPNAVYAKMGYGWANFSRNTLLVEKYEHNGVLDEDFTLVGVRSEPILQRSLDYSRGQLALALDALHAKGYSPALLVAVFQSAGYDREQADVETRFTAIEDSNGAFALARILAYLGGFQGQGYER